MKIIAYNQRMLDVAIAEIQQQFNENKQVAISCEVFKKPKTKNQLGMFFGGLVDSVKDFLFKRGDDRSKEAITDNFYQASMHFDDEFKVERKLFNGDSYTIPLTLSRMDINQASKFIDLSMYLIDNSSVFDGLILHPSLRYCWINKITDNDIYNMKDIQVPMIDKEYLEHTRKQACLWCGKVNNSHAHHLRIDSLGGTGIKPSDVYTVPLCPECHKRLHDNGAEAFYNDCEWITKKISLANFAKIRYFKWRNKR